MWTNWYMSGADVLEGPIEDDINDDVLADPPMSADYEW